MTKVIVSLSAKAPSKIEVANNELLKLKKSLVTYQTKVKTVKAAIAEKSAEIAALEEKAAARTATGRKPREPKPSVPASSDAIATLLKNAKSFDVNNMQGKEWFDILNGKSKAMAKTEGYWRDRFKTGLSGLPFPVVYAVKGYNKDAFIKQLELIQRKSRLMSYKGMAANRWTGAMNGAGEYSSGGWRWPSGLMLYFKKGVPPSRKFYEFIMGKSNANLPTYGR